MGDYYDMKNTNDEKVEVLIDYLKHVHPDYMKEDDNTIKRRHNYNPEPQDEEAVARFSGYGIQLEDLNFDKIMHEFQMQDENKHLNHKIRNDIQNILTGYLSKRDRELRDKRKQNKRTLGGKKKSKRKNSKKRNTKKNKK